MWTDNCNCFSELPANSAYYEGWKTRLIEIISDCKMEVTQQHRLRQSIKAQVLFRNLVARKLSVVKELYDMMECCIYYATSTNNGSKFVQYADAHTRGIYSIYLSSRSMTVTAQKCYERIYPCGVAVEGRRVMKIQITIAFNIERNGTHRFW